MHQKSNTFAAPLLKRQTMKVALFQTDIIYGAPEWNLDKVSRWIEGLPANIDLAILPEMFDTGNFKCESKSTIADMTRIATNKQIAICFTTYIERNNRFCFIHPDGNVEFYNKRHSFPLSGEGKYIENGEERILINYKGFRILPLVCYDLRFPIWSYNQKNDPYDLIIYLASWPSDRINVWNTLLPARAIENVSYVIGVNRVGDDKKFHYPGLSKIIDYKGDIIKSADSDLECSVCADLDIEALHNFRGIFCTFEDSENFILNR